jgi:hypothetical protein
MLILVKVLHTVVWWVMVACIGGVYYFASANRFGWALAMIGIVFGEVLVLLVNRWRCPLTPLAARYTDDREPNFDIYLPARLAKYNKEIFGTLYVVGVVYALLRWLVV